MRLQRFENFQIPVGPSILALVTRGLYDNPMVIYREYLQNAIDALVAYDEGARSRIAITIDRRQRRVEILDYGPGLSYQACLDNLLPIAHSGKVTGHDRGFRGIGRLSGLAFAGSVTFLTRSRVCDPVTKVVWSSASHVDWNNPSVLTAKAGENIVNVVEVPGDGYPEHFFQVEVGDVTRQAAELLLNHDAVRAYIGEVCPVPMNPGFPFARQVEDLFGHGAGLHVREVTVGNDPEPVCRPYGARMELAPGREDYFGEFEEIRIPNLEGSGEAAVGWLAHTSYKGAIPKGNGVRGIRARAGNIQIGDEKVFDHLFVEARFNRWCVGELHVVDPRVVVNTRRDYFEANPHLRNLENHLGPIFQRLSAKCRSSSGVRNKTRKLLSDIGRLETMSDLLHSGYLTVEDRSALLEQLQRGLQETPHGTFGSDTANLCVDRIDRLRRKLKEPVFCESPAACLSMDPSAMTMFQKLSRAVLAECNSPDLAKRIIDRVLSERIGLDG